MTEKLPKHLLEAAYRKAIQDSYRKCLYTTCVDLLGYKDVNWFTHGTMITALERPTTKRKLVIMPRGSLKSSIGCVAFPIWKLLNNPNERILIDSELFTNSSNFIREIQAHLQGDKFISIFGDWKSRQWTQDSFTISARTKIYKEASISAGGIGTTRVGQHYSLIIGDDYNSPKNSATPEGIQKVISHYRYNQSILDPDGTYAIIGTRYADQDIPGYILNMLSLDPHPINGVYDSNYGEVGNGLL